jgi:protein-disulfide isomerase
MISSSSKTRRAFLEMAGLAAGALALPIAALPGAALAQAVGSVSVADLMAEGALPDVWQGSKDAPVTIIEYASMTCSHCAHFHEATYPVLKSKYIDTGKVRFTLREFPFDPIAVAGFMVARCAGEKREAMIGLLFSQQKNWAFSDKPLQGLTALVKQTGMSQEKFDACLQDKALYANVNQVFEKASKVFKVDSTPTFFINGKKVSGALSPDELDKQLEPLLKS